MIISLELIKTLREKTGVGVMEAKKVLQQTNGDIEKAVDELKKHGQKIAAKKASRLTGEGCIGSYVHFDGKTAALVAVKCETDFVARNEQFKNLAADLAMQVAALKPKYIKPEDIPADTVEEEKNMYREQLKNAGKPAAILDKIIVEKLQSFYQENCLLKQRFFKDDSKTIEELLQEHIQKLGENIQIENITLVTI